MLSYSLPAALALLRSKLSSPNHLFATNIEDLEFLREQYSYGGNTARVYKWDVKRRRERRGGGGWGQ